MEKEELAKIISGWMWENTEYYSDGGRFGLKETTIDSRVDLVALSEHILRHVTPTQNR